jgi:hypothetical protein
MLAIIATTMWLEAMKEKRDGMKESQCPYNIPL